ncbi:uroporphyrinogen-III C-methyltransferase [Oceanobacillus senegalensis]|uniref:uroporphyrinogen-III C-methyltransferase n=1 Tax=Oceanobacillus senegalensis TaxID=1936063 RepID=UPI000A311016|nr:uroporphyrinogen-III C-methyltransferase [Oceanobacillus senegalensis]
MGKVYLVGAGPGDPDLITVKGLKTIQQSDVIIYDRLVNEELMNHAPKNARLVYCGKSPDYHVLKQEEINNLLCKYAKDGCIVTRLKGGDPFIFGRGGEEAEVLARNGIPFEVVPGITAGSAAPAYAGIPLTHRNYSSSVAFVTGVKPKGYHAIDYWRHLALGPETLCIYMGVRNLPHICEILINHGRSPLTPVALVHCGTTEEQQTVTGTLEDISQKARGISNPAMIVIGEVVRLREEMKWFEEMANHHEFQTPAVSG